MTIHCFNIKYEIAEEALAVMKEIGFEPVFITELLISPDEDEVSEFVADPVNFITRTISGVNDFPVASFDFEVL